MRWLVLKSFKSNKNLPLLSKTLISAKQNTLVRKGAVHKITNRCVQSGRKHAVFKQFKQSRFLVRKNSHMGIIPGLRRAS